MRRLANRVAIVTGSASGIGAAVVDTFLREGALAVARKPGERGTPCATLPATQRSVREIVADLAESGAADAVVSACMDAYGRLDVLVQQRVNR